ncbi:MAG: MarR family winged helix-turn-helix transcriptional regulator [Acidimicrobiales bacterium]
MTSSGRGIDPTMLGPSGALLAANIALSDALDRQVVDQVGYDSTTLDLLTRLALAPDGQLRAVELCRQLLLSPSHVSRMLDRAQDAGLVRREPDPTDRRAHQVVLTPAGQDVVDAVAPLLHGALQQIIFDRFEPDELESLVGLLERLEEGARLFGAEQ